MRARILKQRRGEGGFTLIVVMILLAVMLIVGAGAIEMAAGEVDAANGYRKVITMESCARAVRQVLISQLRFGTGLPSTIQAVNLTDAGGNPELTLDSGHDPASPASVVQDQAGAVVDVEIIPDSALGAGRTGVLHPRMTNEATDVGSMVNGMRVFGRCRDRVGRTQEIEFTIRYGF